MYSTALIFETCFDNTSVIFSTEFAQQTKNVSLFACSSYYMPTNGVGVHEKQKCTLEHFLLRWYWRLNRIFRIMTFFKHMRDYLKWDLYAKFQRSRLKRSRVINERSLVSTGSFAEKTWTAYCKNLCVVFVCNSPKSTMLRDLSICSLLRER